MPKAKTLADFKAAHDPNVIVPSKIKAALAMMLKEDPEQWHYEAEFIKLAGVSQTQLSQFREQFEPHIVQTQHCGGRQPKRVWFADPKVAKKARGE